MQQCVCILTAGRGTRMGALGDNLNKALLPINQKAAISWIIEKFAILTKTIPVISYRTMRIGYDEHYFSNEKAKIRGIIPAEFTRSGIKDPPVCLYILPPLKTLLPY